jgi:hypothetical protein
MSELDQDVIGGEGLRPQSFIAKTLRTAPVFRDVGDGNGSFEAGSKTFPPAAFVIHGGIVHQHDVDQLLRGREPEHEQEREDFGHNRSL